MVLHPERQLNMNQVEPTTLEEQKINIHIYCLVKWVRQREIKITPTIPLWVIRGLAILAVIVIQEKALA